ERRLVLVGLSLMAVAFAALPLAGSVGLLMIPLMLAATGRGVCQPPLMGLASLNATPSTRGMVMGVFQSSAAAARVGGPVLAGALYDLDQAFPFWMAAALVATATAIALGIRDHPSRETVPAEPPVLV
ncbi:MAG: MFS transporter, partial [bacterium]